MFELQAALEAARNGQFASAAPIDQLPAAGEPAQPRTRRRTRPPVTQQKLAVPGDPVPGAWLLGTHGASGARCLSAVLPGTRYASQQWPESCGARAPLVLVCRSNHRGLTSAQEYARAYRDGELAGQLQLLGVIVSADAPARRPVALRRLERLLSGAVPILAHVPWEPQWRLGPPSNQSPPPAWVAKIAEALTAAVGARR